MIVNNNSKVIFFGSGDFCLPILKRLLGSSYKLLLAISQPDRPRGRKMIPSPTSVKKFAIANKLRHTEPASIKKGNFLQNLKSLHPDIGIVCDYGEILPPEILILPKYQTYNIHPSLLPKYRGSSPLQSAIMNGDKTTGITIIKMDEQMDHGPIIAQQETKLYNNDTGLSLHNRLAQIAAELLIKTLPQILSNKAIPVTQNEKSASYSKKLARIDGQINWDNNALSIERQIRAFYPWPGTYSFFSLKDKKEPYRIKINKAILPKNNPFSVSAKPGDISLKDNGLIVQTGRGPLEILTLTPAGKKELTTKEFLAGYKNKLINLLS